MQSLMIVCIISFIIFNANGLAGNGLSVILLR